MTLAQGIYPVSHSWRWCPAQRRVSWSWNLRNFCQTDQTDCFLGYLVEKYSKLAKPDICKCQACWRFLTCQARRISRFDPVGTTSGDVGTLLYRVSEDPKQDCATSPQVTGFSRMKFDSGSDVWVTRTPTWTQHQGALMWLFKDVQTGTGS